MKLLKLFIYCSILSACYSVFANKDEADYDFNNNGYELHDEFSQQYADISSQPALSDWTAEDLALGGSMGGGGNRGRGGWFSNPFKWSGGQRTWYNPFSWGNPVVVPPTTIVTTTPLIGPDDDLDAQINAANQRAKKLEFLLAKQKQIQALEDLNQQSGGGSSGGGDAQ